MLIIPYWAWHGFLYFLFFLILSSSSLIPTFSCIWKVLWVWWTLLCDNSDHWACYKYATSLYLILMLSREQNAVYSCRYHLVTLSVIAAYTRFTFLCILATLSLCLYAIRFNWSASFKTYKKKAKYGSWLVDSKQKKKKKKKDF